MSSDYSPFSQGPPIIHRDETPEKPELDPEQPPEADETPDADTDQDLMAQARQPDADPFPDDWAVTCESGQWVATLNPQVPLTEVEVELGYGRTITKRTRPDLLAAVRGRDELRAGPCT